MRSIVAPLTLKRLPIASTVSPALRRDDEAVTRLLEVREELVGPDGRARARRSRRARAIFDKSAPLRDEGLERHPFLQPRRRVDVVPAAKLVDRDVHARRRFPSRCRRREPCRIHAFARGRRRGPAGRRRPACPACVSARAALAAARSWHAERGAACRRARAHPAATPLRSASFAVVVRARSRDLLERLAEAHDVSLERDLVVFDLREARDDRCALAVRNAQGQPRSAFCPSTRCATSLSFGGVRDARSSGLSASRSFTGTLDACAIAPSATPNGARTSSNSIGGDPADRVEAEDLRGSSSRRRRREFSERRASSPTGASLRASRAPRSRSCCSDAPRATTPA